MSKTIIMKTLSNQVFEQLNQRKMTRTISITEKDIAAVLEVVDQVNALERYDHTLNGVRLEDVFLPDWTKDFIFPERVAIKSGFECPDLVVRPNKDKEFVYDEFSVRRVENYIASSFKSSAKGLVTAKSLREAKGDIVIDTVKFAVVNGDRFSCRRGETENFIPVPVDGSLARLYGDYYFNTSVEETIKLYFLRAFGFGYGRSSSGGSGKQAKQEANHPVSSDS